MSFRQTWAEYVQELLISSATRKNQQEEKDIETQEKPFILEQVVQAQQGKNNNRKPCH